MYPGIKGRTLAASGLQPGSRPSDFFFFGCLTEKLTDSDCTTRDELKQAIIGMLNGIAHDVLVSVFASWMTRLRWVIEHQEEYCRK
jgi:hypothetical protein